MSSFPPDYPIEYIEGKVRFFGRDFFVTPSVLIPRLETESLVRRARKILQGETPQKNPMMKTQNESVSGKADSIQNRKIVVDIGCGSGIIGTSVADLVDEVIFLDISPDALRVAEQNFRTHFPEKKAQFIVSNLLTNIPRLQHSKTPTFQDSNILFVTNLPYIKNEDWEHMSADTVHEPRLALFGGEMTGFELYERLFEQFHALDRHFHCIYEFGYNQRAVAESTIKKYPHWEYSFFQDYAGVERFGELHIINCI